MSLKTFTDAYMKCILFAETGCPHGDCERCREYGGPPLVENFGPEDFSDEALKRIEADCAKFYADMAAAAPAMLVKDYWRDDDAQAGHDFWLTRNGHGAGFWDGDWPEKQGEALTKLSREFGSLDVYVGDDGKLYFS